MGLSSAAIFGDYGHLGVTSPDNMPPARTYASSWTDSNGNFWLFGGLSGSGYTNDLWKFNPATNEWVWISGSDTAGQAGSYGVLGQAAAGNVPGGREGAVSWIDPSGNFWLFGGFGLDASGTIGLLSDLWRFDPSLGANGEWAWMGGNSAFPTTPPAPRNSPAWPGVYGTLGTASATSIPGGRDVAVGWSDQNGNLWLFGGAGEDAAGNQGELNDLWKFNPTLGTYGEWIWMGGEQTLPLSSGPVLGSPGVYGTLGTASATNAPGGRQDAVGWADSSGNFWLFGGVGNDAVGAEGYLNDLWKFDPSTGPDGEWAWMSGSSTLGTAYCYAPGAECGQPGVYGTLGQPGAGNVPRGRRDASAAVDSTGKFWVFGGFDEDDPGGSEDLLNDLWEFDPSLGANGEWAWMSGSGGTGTCQFLSAGSCALMGIDGVYGSLGNPSALNAPGSRYGAASWSDKSGNFWLFSGTGLDSEGNFVGPNDLWEFAYVAAAPIFNPPAGTYATVQSVTISDATPGAVIYYTTDGMLPSSSSTPYTGAITVSSTETIEAIAITTGYFNSPVASATYTINVPITAAPTFSPPAGTYASAQTVTITDATPAAVIYFTTDGTVPTTASSVYGTPVIFSKSGTLEAMAVATGDLPSPVASATYTITSSSSGAGEWTWMGGSSTLPNSYGSPGVYGTLGVAAPGNIPGGRNFATSWTDSSGNLWLFGGFGQTPSAVLFNDLWRFSPAANEWTWMSGSSTESCSSFCGEPGIYGTLGTPSAANVPGGRESALSWVDTSGHLWLYGGYGFDANGVLGLLNDLWQFDTSSDEWTWMGGSSTLLQAGEGQAPVYGALGTFAAGNNPGGREFAASWTDSSGHFWLFGGQGYYAAGLPATFNDLWEFDPSKKQWAWMAGSSTAGSNCPNGNCVQAGVYGTLGVPAAGNTPGSRNFTATWTDSNGHLWLFGGSIPGVHLTYLDDLWEYYPSTNEWAWMGGSSMLDQPGMYGTAGTPAAANIPGSRCCMVSWTGANGQLWLLGGQGYDSNDNQGDLNDLWEFDPSTDEWSWMDGSGTVSAGGAQPGVYGTLGVPAPANVPGGRQNSVSWTGNNGDFWLFGGSGADANGSLGNLNDVWRYRLGSATLPSAATPTFTPPAGTYTAPQSVTISDATQGATIYYTTNGTTPSNSSTPYTGPIAVSATETIEAIALETNYANSAVASATYLINLPTAAAPTFNPPAGTYTSAQSVTLSDTTPGAVIYYSIAVAGQPSPTPILYIGPIAVSSTETIQAFAEATNYLESPVASATYTINLPPPTFTLAASPTSLTISSGGQGDVTLTVTPQNGFNSAVSFACGGLPTGASCTFNPATVTPPAGTTTTLAIDAGSQSATLKRSRGTLFPGAALALAVCIFGWRRRRNLQLALLVAVAFTSLILLSGCGATFKTIIVPVTSTITVTATSGSIQQTATVSVTVN